MVNSIMGEETKQRDSRDRPQVAVSIQILFKRRDTIQCEMCLDRVKTLKCWENTQPRTIPFNCDNFNLKCLDGYNRQPQVILYKSHIGQKGASLKICPLVCKNSYICTKKKSSTLPYKIYALYNDVLTIIIQDRNYKFFTGRGNRQTIKTEWMIHDLACF